MLGFLDLGFLDLNEQVRGSPLLFFCLGGQSPVLNLYTVRILFPTGYETFPVRGREFTILTFQLGRVADKYVPRTSAFRVKRLALGGILEMLVNSLLDFSKLILEKFLLYFARKPDDRALPTYDF